MTRTEILTRPCPLCGTAIRIPVIYESGDYDEGESRPWRLGRGHGCPGGCELTNKQIEQLI